MPAIGVAMSEGLVVRWLKSAGDPIEAGEPLLEIETDKTLLELESPAAGTIIVNVSRGGLVDQVALRAALVDGHLSGAALDVLAHEPPSPDDPILDTPNLLLSPHIAWYSSASELRVRRQVVDGVLRCLAGEAPATGRIALDPRVAEGG